MEWSGGGVCHSSKQRWNREEHSENRQDGEHDRGTIAKSGDQVCNADDEQAGGRASQGNLYASINLFRGAVSISVEQEESSCQCKEDQPVDA